MKQRIGLLSVLILFLFSVPLLSEQIHKPGKIFKSGEALVYKVKWSFLRVGTLRLQNEGIVTRDGKPYYKLKIIIDSASGIPFVKIHDIYESYVDSNAVPVAFYAWERKGDYTLKTDYLFHGDANTVEVRVAKIYPDRIETVIEKVVPVRTIHRDVLSLLFYARQSAGKKMADLAVPTFVLNGPENCYFYKTGQQKRIKYSGKKANSFYLKGKVKFIGIAGVKDDFEGWFSTDERRVPLKAKMKAFFGSVTLELEQSENWLTAIEE